MILRKVIIEACWIDRLKYIASLQDISQAKVIEVVLLYLQTIV